MLQIEPIPTILLGSLSLFLLFLVHEVIFVLVDALFHFRQFQWFHTDYLVFGSALAAGDHIAFFHFFYVDIKIAFAFRAACHGSLLSPGIL